MNHAGQAQRKGKEPYRILLTILTGIAGIAMFGGILLMSQSRMAELALQEEMKENSSYITNAFTYYEASGKIIPGWSDRLHETYFFMMKYALEQDPDLLSDQSSSEAFLGEMSRLTGAQDIMLVDRNGNVLASDTGFFRDLKEEMYAPLFHTFDTFEMEKLPIYAFTAENRQSRLTPADPQDSNGAQTAQVETEKIEAGPPEQAVDSSWKESYYGASNSFPILYSMAIDDQRACVINDYGVVQMMYEDLTDVWNYILKNEVIGSNGYAFVWSAGTGEILYYPEPDFKGRDVSVLGMDMDGIHNGTFVREKVNGEDMYLYPVYFDAQGVWIACAVPAKALTRGRRLTGLMLWLLFGVLAADLAYYAILLLKQKKAVTGGGILPFVKQRPESSRKTKLLIFTAFCTIAIFLSAFYVQTLYLMSDWARNGTAQIERIINDLSYQEIPVKGIRQFYADGSEKLAKLAGWYLEKHPEKATTDTLDTLTDILTLENISIVDKAGNVTTASSAYLPEFVNAWELRATLNSGPWSLLAEYANKSQDPSYDNGYSYSHGSAILLSGSYSKNGLSLLLQAKRSENMSFRSKRSMIGTSSFINYLPAFTQEHTYALAALYPYATQLATGEWAWQAVAGYNFKRHTTLGGKYGMNAKLNFSHVRWEGETYYQDIDIQISRKLSRDFKLSLMYMNQQYNKTIIEGHGGMVHSNVFIAEGQYKLSPKSVLRSEVQYLTTADDQGDWAYALAELSLTPHWMFSVSDMYNVGETHIHYYQGGVTFTASGHRLQIGYGRTRAGYNCSGGVCRYVPSSRGFTMSYNYSF